MNKNIANALNKKANFRPASEYPFLAADKCDELYDKALLMLRRKVEIEDQELDAAFGEVQTECTLGLNQIERLQKEAEAFYGKVAENKQNPGSKFVLF